ncbi:MAG: acetate--CoA ligase family protein, partial [Acidimicrobiales bacterium]
AYDIHVSRDIVSASRNEAAKAATSLGMPVVMKILSPEIMHKSDLGLVAIGVSGEREVRNTYDTLVSRASEAAPHASIDGVVVCEMVTGGVETVVGVAQDDLFGPVVMFGLGGVLVELLQDVTFRIPPFDRTTARIMLGELKGSPLLRGIRGRPACDTAALVDVIMKVQRLAVDMHSELAELDINPLMVLPKGAVALDALAVPT